MRVEVRSCVFMCVHNTCVRGRDHLHARACVGEFFECICLSACIRARVRAEQAQFGMRARKPERNKEQPLSWKETGRKGQAPPRHLSQTSPTCMLLLTATEQVCEYGTSFTSQVPNRWSFNLSLTQPHPSRHRLQRVQRGAQGNGRAHRHQGSLSELLYQIIPFWMDSIT